jgi:hypothetical protein
MAERDVKPSSVGIFGAYLRVYLPEEVFSPKVLVAVSIESFGKNVSSFLPGTASGSSGDVIFHTGAVIFHTVCPRLFLPTCRFDAGNIRRPGGKLLEALELMAGFPATSVLPGASKAHHELTSE